MIMKTVNMTYVSVCEIQ